MRTSAACRPTKEETQCMLNAYFGARGTHVQKKGGGRACVWFRTQHDITNTSRPATQNAVLCFALIARYWQMPDSKYWLSCMPAAGVFQLLVAIEQRDRIGTIRLMPASSVHASD